MNLQDSAATARQDDRNFFKHEGLIMKPVEDFTVFDGFLCCDPDDKDADIDNFLRDGDASRYFNDKVAVTYGLFFDRQKWKAKLPLLILSRLADKLPFFSRPGWESKLPLGFATLQNDAIEIPIKDYYPNMPAVKIGHFGIRREFQRRKIGSTFLYMIYQFMRQANNRTGCRFLTLNTYEPLVKFYEDNNFIVFNGKPRNPQSSSQSIMYLDLLAESFNRWPPKIEI